MRDVIENENYGSAYGVYNVPDTILQLKQEQPRLLQIQEVI